MLIVLYDVDRDLRNHVVTISLATAVPLKIKALPAIIAGVMGSGRKRKAREKQDFCARCNPRG